MALPQPYDEQHVMELQNFRELLDFDSWPGQRPVPTPPCDWVSSLLDVQTVAPVKTATEMEQGAIRKRKCPSLDSVEPEDDDDMEVDDVKRFARQNHSEIEKRRRDKMNTYIVQLSNMLPTCSAMNRKLDKLTVLRMAVQHLKSLRGASATYTEASNKPSFLSDDELKHLILEAADGFLFAVGCDRARILFVSESVQKVLHYSRAELIGQSLFDYLHPQDINKVKEQFSPSDLSPRERLIDSKTFMPVKTELPQRPTHLCSGARRSFYCRMKCKPEVSETLGPWGNLKMEKDSDLEFCHRKRKSDQKSFTVIHCTGYLKSWPTSKINLSEQEDNDDSYYLSCLVAVGQIRTPYTPSPTAGLASTSSLDPNQTCADLNIRPLHYILRITIDGKLTFIDQATTVVLGYLPQELLGTSVYEYYHQDDIVVMAEIHRKVLNTSEKIQTNVYRFKSKNGSFLPVRSNCFSFKNPWTKEVEYIVFSNTAVPIEEVSSSGQNYETAGLYHHEKESLSSEKEIDAHTPLQDKSQLYVPGLPGGTRPGAGRIGRQIAEELLEQSRSVRQSTAPQTADSTNIELPTYGVQHGPKRHNPVTTETSSETVGSASLAVPVPSGSGHPHSRRNGINTDVSRMSVPHLPEQASLLDTVIEEQAYEDIANPGGSEGGDEAAMSIIMSLLEADAGLGGPIDFNDLPWPL